MTLLGVDVQRLLEHAVDGAREALAKAKKIYGGHMGGGLEEQGIWGTPERVIECIERHRTLGCTGFLIEFFGRDTRPAAQLFAERGAFQTVSDPAGEYLVTNLPFKMSQAETAAVPTVSEVGEYKCERRSNTRPR